MTVPTDHWAAADAGVVCAIRISECWKLPAELEAVATEYAAS
jgi:hypothetical protein